MRRAARVDANQKQIVEYLRKHGCSVQVLHTVGKGCPDILVGYGGKNYLFEIKDGQKSRSAQKLTPDEDAWHFNWRGQVDVVTCEYDCDVAMNVMDWDEKDV